MYLFERKIVKSNRNNLIRINYPAITHIQYFYFISTPDNNPDYCTYYFQIQLC